MTQQTHKLEIFRGLLKFKSNEQKIWAVLLFLSIVTAIEVSLGIIRPHWSLTTFIGMKLLNFIFILLTLVKAYYIAWDFMHLRDEKKSFKLSIVLPLTILIPYLTLILLLEADYVYDIMRESFVSWDF
jgi:cytochrome c oxidase subunit IV